MSILCELNIIPVNHKHTLCTRDNYQHHYHFIPTRNNELLFYFQSLRLKYYHRASVALNLLGTRQNEMTQNIEMLVKILGKLHTVISTL